MATMASPLESIEKYAAPVLSGSITALALLLVADGWLGGVFKQLEPILKLKDDAWSFVLIVPVIAVIYALGLVVTTGSALFAHWWNDNAQERERDALALIAAAKSDLLNQKFGEIVRSWKTLEGLCFPLFVLFVGIIWERYQYKVP
jgi:hypothetical protein